MLDIYLDNTYFDYKYSRAKIKHNQNNPKLSKNFSTITNNLVRCQKLDCLRQKNIENTAKVNNNLIHIISDIEVLTLSYELIKYKPSKMINGLKSKTFSNIELNWLNLLSKQILTGKIINCDLSRSFEIGCELLV